tara:strand:- start:446 stop:691 length:246 start_codon:yes stop_codon:yes gene_type:complete
MSTYKSKSIAKAKAKKSTFKPKTEEDLPKGPDSDFEQMKRFMRIKAREDKFKKMPLKPGEEGKAEPIGTHDPSEKPVYKKL